MESSTGITSRHAHQWLHIIGGTARVLFLVMAIAVFPKVFAGEAEHYDAALSVVVLPTHDEVSRVSDELVDAEIRSKPGLRNREALIRNLIADLYRSDELKSRVARVYMQHFNEQELRELAKLIRNPVVVKYRQIVPTLYRQIADIERELYERQLQPLVAARRADQIRNY